MVISLLNEVDQLLMIPVSTGALESEPITVMHLRNFQSEQDS